MRYIINLTLLVGFFLVLTQSANTHENYKAFENEDWSMRASVKTQNNFETLKKLTMANFDIAGVDTKNNFVDVLINTQQFEQLKHMGFDVIIRSTKGVNKGPDDEYKNPAEIEQLIKQAHNDFPNITKLVSIGKSVEGRDIWAIKISDNPQADEISEPTLLFNSMHHAREIMTPEISIDIIEYLTTNYNNDQVVTDWVNQNQIWVIPMLNVDGNQKMWDADKWWRKNTRGGYGVDLNRNYPTGWKSCNGSSGFRWSQTYRGPSPASEPETQAMMNFVAKIRPVFDISYHSYSELVIYPYGCKGQRTQNSDVVEKIGKDIGSLLNYKAGTAWELLYNADGGDIDWMYDTYQVIPFVIELNSSNDGFHPSYKVRDKTVELNRKGWEYLITRAHSSGVRGQFLKNNRPVKNGIVEVYKTGKKQVYLTYPLHLTGVFHIVLNPGDYELVFKSNNRELYKSQITIDDDLERVNYDI